ncbi:hypothetical protein L6164_037470 [Bauhinia variegata]|uniref:Uncharacterized protein n=1 Tax=Bauhinia variegata TaxID=167791 RepID=A0ACB9KK91_BAUVA|nr:hypothetical protein L6164_037470 [Bauhinia variegata]
MDSSSRLGSANISIPFIERSGFSADGEGLTAGLSRDVPEGVPMTETSSGGELANPPQLDVLFHFYSKEPQKAQSRILVFFCKKRKSLIVLVEESAKQFKQWSFRVIEPQLGHPFFLDDDGEPRFPLRW